MGRIDPKCAKIFFDNLAILDTARDEAPNCATIGEFEKVVLTALV